MPLLKRLVSGAARRLGSWPLQAIGSQLRAEVLEQATEDAITAVSIPGGQIQFRTPSPMLISRAASVLSKETDTIQWIDDFESETVFWDVGANVGVYSLYAAFRRKVAVLAFEPSAANFHVLCGNIHLNQVDQRVNAYCLAFSRQTQLGVLNLTSLRMGAAVSQFGEPNEASPYSEKPSETISQGMLGFSIDDFIRAFDPPFPNNLKMDVDGLEVPILEGARRTLRDPRLQSVMVELSISRPLEQRKALSLLEEAGLKLISRGETQGTKVESAANHLFQRVASPVSSGPADSNVLLCNAESADLAK